MQRATPVRDRPLAVKCWTVLRLRIIGSRRDEVELRIRAGSVIRAIDERQAAGVILTEVDRLLDLGLAAFDLSRCSVVDDIAL